MDPEFKIILAGVALAIALAGVIGYWAGT